MTKQKREETCWDIARRQAELARKRAARREGLISGLLASPEGALLVAGAFALMNVARSLGDALAESLLGVRQRREADRPGLNAPAVAPAAGVPWTPLVRVHERRQVKIPFPSPVLSFSLAIGILETSSRGFQLRHDAPSVDEAWAFVSPYLSEDAALYLRNVFAEGGGAWTPLKYDLIKRPAVVQEIWADRGRAIREEAKALKEPEPKVTPEEP